MKKLYQILLGVPTLFVVALLGVACENEQTSTPYVAVSSGAFTFDAQRTAINTISVQSNVEWRVCWSPEVEGVVVAPASGRGDGVVVVEQMPQGAHLRFAVCHEACGSLIRSNSVVVSRQSADPYADPEPEVSSN